MFAINCNFEFLLPLVCPVLLHPLLNIRFSQKKFWNQTSTHLCTHDIQEARAEGHSNCLLLIRKNPNFMKKRLFSWFRSYQWVFVYLVNCLLLLFLLKFTDKCSLIFEKFGKPGIYMKIWINIFRQLHWNLQPWLSYIIGKFLKLTTLTHLRSSFWKRVFT